MASGELRGRTALVTGAGGDIGRAIALALAERGAALVLVGRRRERLEAVAAQIAARGGAAAVVPGDVTRTDWHAALDRAAPAVDVLVNNAADYARYARLERVPEDELRRTIDAILLGALLTARRVIPGMRERRFGRIVSIGSAAASLGAAGQTAYAAAKAGLQGFTRSVALEVGRDGITCNLIEPGLVRTAGVDERVPPERQRALLAHSALGRAGLPSEIADLVAYLASDAGAFVTGAVLPASGGLGLGLFSREPDPSGPFGPGGPPGPPGPGGPPGSPDRSGG